jgi:Tfp pilus assembly protein PilF/SAM-dependent methyltransferase
MARDPLKSQRRLERALEDFRSGRLDEAARAARKVLAASPADASALNLLAAIASNQNQHQDAKEFLVQALRSQPRNPFILFNLGQVYRRLGMNDDAMLHFKKSIALKSDYADAHQQLGEIARSAGDWDAAAKAFRAALAINPAMATAHYGLGRIFMETGDNKAAVVCLERALSNLPSRTGPRAAATYANLGVARIANGFFEQGLHALCEAIDCDRGWADAWRLLAQHLANAAVIPQHARFREYLLCLFARADINPRALATAAMALLKRDDRWQALLRSAERDGARSIDFQGHHAEAWKSLVSEPLFLTLLRQAPIPDIGCEVLLTAWRRRLLLTPGALEEADPGILSASAAQCFLNEYVYATDAEEEAALAALTARLGSGLAAVGPKFWTAAALVACYTMLGNTPVADWASEAPGLLATLLRMQIEEPRTESMLREKLARLKPVRDELSRAVQRQYEENPYPRWIRCTQGTPRRLPDVIRRALPHLRDETLPNADAPDILIAGCGTGIQTMTAVGNYLNSNVLAVDVSEASLAYSMRKLKEYGLANVRHLHADILDLDSLEERFDLIECFGVLHHMADSQRGLDVLARRLKPGGVMLLGLYSAIARQSVVAARALIAAKGYPANPGGIRSARTEIMARRDDPALAALVSPASDFWTTSEVRDLLFNVQENRFTLLDIELMLQAAGLEFLGLQPSNAQDGLRFAQQFPQAEALRSLRAWHDFELQNPGSFGETYRFWVRRPVRPTSGVNEARL